MIKVTDIFDVRSRGRLGGRMVSTSTHRVRVRVTGSADLARIATGMEEAGEAKLAVQVRAAKRFTLTMPGAIWRALRKGAGL